jgi:hypothetical protein
MAATSQTPAQKPAFEVASIKPANSGKNGMLIQTEVGRFKAINATVSFLIQYAYGIKYFQLSGGPGWMGSDKFDINACYASGPQLLLRTNPGGKASMADLVWLLGLPGVTDRPVLDRTGLSGEFTFEAKQLWKRRNV